MAEHTRCIIYAASRGIGHLAATQAGQACHGRVYGLHSL